MPDNVVVNITPGYSSVVTREQLKEIVLRAYELGAHCVKEVNSGRGWTDTKYRAERAALNRLLKLAGFARDRQRLPAHQRR